MTKNLLSIKDLSASAQGKEILSGINLDIAPNTTHVLMGPNGAGKTTLGKVIMANSAYKQTQGDIEFLGENINDLPSYKRSQMGIFLSYQSPIEIPGLSLREYLRSIAEEHKDLRLSSRKFKKKVAEICEVLNISPDYLDRQFNVGFSGGEKKKIEMLQLLLLQPKLAILDETDSGLDVDAMRTVSKAVRYFQEKPDTSVLIITHNTRILDEVHVDFTQVMVDGTIVDSQDKNLILEIDKLGFSKYTQERV